MYLTKCGLDASTPQFARRVKLFFYRQSLPKAVNLCDILFIKPIKRLNKRNKMNWNDIDDIAESLEDQYPDEDVQHLTLTEIYRFIVEINDLDPDAEKIDESILESIQEAWLALRDEE